ncbi:MULTISPECIES: hypothetical protein [unclassified Bradyrhizobium]|uniref:hypothetical protein n=1 Tax=unclassified Bradyrhizobium TaxID=2631580 RepID=UPI00211F144D|nr:MULTISPECIES: hypothetical protein [unclassified Bradyrhizobium]
MSARTALHVRCAIALVVLTLASVTLFAAASRDTGKRVAAIRPQLVNVIARVAP